MLKNRESVFDYHNKRETNCRRRNISSVSNFYSGD